MPDPPDSTQRADLEIPPSAASSPDPDDDPTGTTRAESGAPEGREHDRPFESFPLRVVGDFALLEKLGEGAMGVVYLAEHRTNRQRVALKLIKGDLRVSPQRLERFRREGLITASLRHPGIVGIHAAGVSEETPYCVYEFVESARTLKEVLPTLSLEAKVEALRDVARALAHAHEAGVVHRDVKPENVLVDLHGRVRVADFGIAAAADMERITRSGALVGTPRYMAPEAAFGRTASPSLDVWALGVILYEALAGRHPIEASSWFDYLARARKGVVEPPTSEAYEVPTDLAEIALRALEGDPKARTSTAAQFADDLDRYLQGESLEARPRSKRGWAVGGSVLALLLLGAALASLAQAASPAPPELSWVAPQDTQRCSNTSQVEITGRVESRSEWVELHVTGLSAPVRVRPGPFSFVVPLTPGVNHLELRAISSEGASSAETRSVTLELPAWFLELTPARRPKLPLPEALELSEAGCRNRADDSILIWIPPATTRLGSNRPDERFRLAEGPEHEVRLDGYFLGKFEVTWEQFRRFCLAKGKTPHEPLFSVEDNHPVHAILWSEAQAYCTWAGLRLPTEAEWEHAARGPQRLTHAWGLGPLDKTRGNFEAPPPTGDRYPYTSPVGSFPRGVAPFGCFDMVGNVWEWVFDHPSTYSPDPQVNPRGPSDGDQRVIRGGAHSSSGAGVSHATYRKSALPEVRNPKVGLRVCLDRRDQ